MKGEYDYQIMDRAHYFLVTNDSGDTTYRFSCEAIKQNEGEPYNATIVKRIDIAPWIGLAQAFQEAGLIPKSAVDAELKATKYHLEDMRKMIDVEG